MRGYQTAGDTKSVIFDISREAPGRDPAKFSGISKRGVHNRRITACTPLCALTRTQPTQKPHPSTKAIFQAYFRPVRKPFKGKQEKVLPLL